jgi:prepilin-type N-terminal cleavage/methylation domain-containing protein
MPLSAKRHGRDRAFTLTELLVVLATLGILTVLLLPALAATRPDTTSFQCLNNKRQLGLACLLYANDNHDRLASNSDRSEALPSAQNWTYPLGVVLDWTTSPSVTFYVNPAYATGNGTGSFTELPGSMHNNAAGLVHADGHAEVHQWLNPQTIKPFNASLTTYLQDLAVTSDQDLTWLAQHTPQN